MYESRPHIYIPAPPIFVPNLHDRSRIKSIGSLRGIFVKELFYITPMLVNKDVLYACIVVIIATTE